MGGSLTTEEPDPDEVSADATEEPGHGTLAAPWPQLPATWETHENIYDQQRLSSLLSRITTALAAPTTGAAEAIGSAAGPAAASMPHLGR